MPTTLDRLTEEAMQLTDDDRATLAERMVVSLDVTENEQIQHLWTEEALRRRDEMRAGTVRAIPLEETLAKARRLVGR